MSWLPAVLRVRKRGFTLVELMVALVGGLFVGLAVLALSRQATTTVFEEARTATAEMSLRLAMDRLRSDVSRASYMASPNLYLEPDSNIMKINNPGAVTNKNTDWGAAGNAPAMLQGMQGVRLIPAGTAPNNTAATSALSTANGLAPDAIRITGNLTTTEEFSIQDANEAAGGSCAGGRRIHINRTPSWYRATAADDGGTATLQSIFTPVAGELFMVRVRNRFSGKSQYLVSCGVGSDGNGIYIDTGNTPPLCRSGPSGAADGCGGGFGSGDAINPIHTVDWYLDTIAAAAGDGGGYARLDTTPADATRFNLFRQWVNVAGTRVGTPELVAEYAVDLKFAFTVDNGARCTACLQGDGQWLPTQGNVPVGGASLLTLGFDQSENATWGGAVSYNPTATVPAVWPQRIRSVRIRLVTRTQQADRNTKGPTTDADTFLYRYCVNPGTCTQFARTRTETTDVNLQNQAQAYYP